MFYLKIFNIFDTNRLYFFLFQIYNCSDIVWIEFVDRKCHWLKYCEIPRLNSLTGVCKVPKQSIC